MKTVSDRLARAVAAAGQSLKSMVKIAVSTRRSGVKRVDGADTIIIMGNGPSLADTIARDRDSLLGYPTMAVNFAANAPEFRELRPAYYVLADPHFFNNTSDPNVSRLIGNLNRVDWPMTLYVPFAARNVDTLIANSNVTVGRFNAVAVEGWRWLERAAYSSGRGMPRPRNVLIPSIMIAMQAGFRNIYVAGADHSWMRTLEVNERNEVVSVQPHFYKEDEQEVKRVRTEYLRYPLHEIVYSFYVAFKAYHDIERYAAGRGVNIYNATPGSFIDAFRRGGLPR